MSSKQKLIKNSFFSFLQIFITGIGLLIVYSFVLRKLGQAELGVWSIITALPTTITAVGTGVSGCILKYVPEYNVGKEVKKINSLFISGFTLNLITSVIIVFLGISFEVKILDLLLNTTKYPSAYLSYFEISLMTLVLNVINSIFFSLFDGLQYTYLKNNIIIIGVITLVILVIGITPLLGLKAIFISQMIQSALVFCMMFFYSVKKKFIEFKLFELSASNIFLFIKEGKKFQTISISLILFEPVTKYYLNKYFNISIVGLYDFVNRIILQFRTLIVGAMQVLIPYVTDRKSSGELNINLFYPNIFKLASLIGAVLFSLINVAVFFIVENFKFNNGGEVILMTLTLSVAYYVNVLSSLGYFVLWGLSRFRHIILSHLLMIFTNYLIYEVVGMHLSEKWSVLPVSLSILVSSIYIYFIFKHEFRETEIRFRPKDISIFIASLLALIMSILLMTFAYSGIFHLYNFIFFSIIFAFLIFYNDFIIDTFKVRFGRIK